VVQEAIARLVVAVALVETGPQVEVDLVATDLLVVAVALVETVLLVVDLQEECLLQCLVERMG